MDAFSAVTERFEVRKYKSACNAPGCEEAPTTEAQVTETETKELRVRQLAAIFLCNAHVLLATELVDYLKRNAPEGTAIGLKELAFGRLPGA